jgi:hypothetical protein
VGIRHSFLQATHCQGDHVLNAELDGLEQIFGLYDNIHQDYECYGKDAYFELFDAITSRRRE